VCCMPIRLCHGACVCGLRTACTSSFVLDDLDTVDIVSALIIALSVSARRGDFCLYVSLQRYTLLGTGAISRV
jgi:hypothetical protein